MRHHSEVLEEMWNEEGESIPSAPHAMQVITMKVSQPVKPQDMIRKSIERSRGKLLKSQRTLTNTNN